MAEGLRRSATAQERTAYDHVTLALFHVCKSVLQLEYLVAMTTLDTDLVDDVIEVSVLLFRMELTLALAALRATLVQPLLYAVPMKDLFAIAALH